MYIILYYNLTKVVIHKIQPQQYHNFHYTCEESRLDFD